MKKITTIIAFALSAAATSTAQDLSSAYFLRGNTFGHHHNPAYINERSYITTPFLPGNLLVGTSGNIGVNDFLYKYNRNGHQLTTFMSPTVSNNDFLRNLHDKNRLGVNVRHSLMGFGFRAWKGFNTVELSLRSQSNVIIPGSLFRFMKQGMTDEAGTTYDMSGIRARTNTYAELALGHARATADGKWQLGAKVKMLLGLAQANLHVDQMTVSMAQDTWHIAAKGAAELSVKSAAFDLKTPDAQGRREIKGLDVDNFGVGGFGLGIDVGAMYQAHDWVDGLVLSAALLDLGYISWSNGLRAQLQDSYTFSGFAQPVTVDDNKKEDPNSLRSQVEQIGDDLEDFAKAYALDNTKGRTTALGATLNVGAAYTLPSHKKLTLGLLSHTYINGAFSSTEWRMSANYALCHWLEGALTYGTGTYGSTLGWVLNAHPRGFNFFVGAEHSLGSLTPQGLPVGNANMRVNLGMNITLGKRTQAANFVY